MECPVRDTFRVRQVAGMFDLPVSAGARSSFTATLPSLEDSWNIGVIVGPSGSGKTTIARQAFGKYLNDRWDWPADKSVLDGFPASLGIREITQLLSSVGFSSPPSWLRPFLLLSNGEQFRVNLARALAEQKELTVIDEFTSVVDRTVAQIGSAAISRAVRRSNRRLLAVSCHYDILPWLEPDWVLDMADGSLTERSKDGELPPSFRRPSIHLEIQRCRPSAWKLFSRHHYLSDNLHPASQCYMGLVSNRPAAFVAILPFPHPTRSGWREHRCVCLPDFQGIGIGHALSEFVASLYASSGKPFTSVTSHPAMIHHRARSPAWRMNRGPSRVPPRHRRDPQSQVGDKTMSCRRITASFRYIGPQRRDLAAQFGIGISHG
jgi:energy-coupling factor transporter ATP-binding protein EcfA2